MVKSKSITKLYCLHPNPLKNVPLINSCRHPRIYATAALYASDLILSARHQKTHILTQKLIGKILNVGEYSVREHYYLYLKAYTTKQIVHIEPAITHFCKH